MELKTVAIRDDGCYGVLLWDTKPFAVTLERTFDERRVVIPAGVLLCKSTFYNKGSYSTFEIEVPDHSRVLFHRGNVETDTTGCVIVAESFGELYGRTAVLDSRHGFDEFIRLTRGLPEFFLNVTR